jgi:hypothetical protein
VHWIGRFGCLWVHIRDKKVIEDVFVRFKIAPSGSVIGNVSKTNVLIAAILLTWMLSPVFSSIINGN